VRLSVATPEIVFPLGPVSVASMPAPTLPGAASMLRAAWPPSTDKGEV